MFITFEGIEGSGKSTQVILLSRYLKKKGYKVVVTREPGGTAFGEALRKVVLKRNERIVPLAELLVIMAMRAQHVEEVILPALKKGMIVLGDRFCDASCAYQGFGRGLDLDVIKELNRLVSKNIEPDLTILLDCNVKLGLKRKLQHATSLDRFEGETLSFHRRIQKGYLKLAKDEPERFMILNGNLSIDSTHQAIRQRVDRLLEAHGF